MYPEERRQEILKQVHQNSRVSVAELSRQFGVSGVTIRADLQALAEQSLVLRTHGGAVVTRPGLAVTSLALRRRQQVTEKNRIGARGASLVANGDAIFLDSSSTTLAIAQRLRNHRDVTLITNSLAIAQGVLDMPGITTVMPGGTVRRETASLVGVEGVEILTKYNIQKGFFGAHGLTPIEGLTDVSAAEAELKRCLVRMCRQVIVVLDATKWGRAGLASFAALQEVQTIVTNDLAPANLVAEARALGIEVLIA